MQQELQLAPCSNTGLNSQNEPSLYALLGLPTPIPTANNTAAPSLSIDGFTLLWDELETFDLLPVIKELLQVEFDFTQAFSMRIGVRWDTVYMGSMGCLYMYRETPTGRRYRIAVSGKACASVPLKLVLRFFEVIYNTNPQLECSRIDICLDDFTKRLTFEKICAALDAKNHSGFRTANSIKNHDALNGWTVYLGSRQSEHMVRIYNKAAESKGVIDSIRWESEYKGDKANSIFRCLSGCSTVDNAVKILKGVVFGKMSFRELDDKNLDRCKLLDWWAEFLDYVAFDAVAVEFKKPVTSIERKVNWIHKQVEKSLALLSQCFGCDKFQSFIDDCIESGSRRLNTFDKLLFKEYLNAEFC